MYSSGGGLKKDEVEGRIMGILQGFDKVNNAANVSVPSYQSPLSVS
jgi:NADH dehydrogenase (ubiquinone) 1 alpha/beta subcomplex 1